ncbi:MAG: hypothetical protein ACJAT4_002510 [Granulosicoccus sp.]|jgi:hypothetical protein
MNSNWNNFKNAAHQIGFCIYHSNQKICADHKNELAKREKTPPADLDIYYFEMKKEWAQNRLQE